LIEKFKQHINSVKNIAVEYPIFNFTAYYKNCLILRIEKEKTFKSSLVFLTDEGRIKSIDIEDKSGIIVKVTSLKNIK